MIISGISASNLLKYEELELHNLPEKGVIAIGGPNESGKSTVGEIICFALFGRSFSLDFDELEKLIRWGEERCSVTLQFVVDPGERFEIARYLDRDGNHGARLSRAGDEERPLARGVEAVETRLYELLGFGYDEFIESFYLAQREITTPHPHSYAVKAMAGLTSLEQVAEGVEDEIETEHGGIDGAQLELESANDELQELDIDDGRLAALEGEREELVAAETELESGMEALDAASIGYREAVPGVRSAQGARGRARLLRAVALLAALALGAGWYLLDAMPDHPWAARLEQLLSGNLAFWQGQVDWLLYGAGGFAVLFLLFWLRSAFLGRRIAALRQAGAVLAERLEEARATMAEPAAAAAEEGGSLEMESEPEPEAGSPRPGYDETLALGHRVAECRADPAEVEELVGRELAWRRGETRLVGDRLVRQDQLIGAERERLRRAENLRQAVSSVEARMADHRARIHKRELALELIKGASVHLSRRFNRDLRDLVGRTLPLFTEDRYEHLQIDDDLTVRVFSSEKRDFMDLEEISSGTQRQIMLAVRLALSQELINSGSLGRQFVFLDEPFAFFDQTRTASALRVLPELSEQITQVWIVAQEFPEGSRFDLSIACSRDETRAAARRD